MKNVKKVLAIVLALVTIFAITACGPKPSEAVKEDIDEIKTESLDMNDILGANESEFDATTKAKFKKVLTKMQEFDYEIVSEKVDGDKAKVKVKISTYPFGQAYEQAYAQIIRDVSAGKIKSEAELKPYYYNSVFDKLNSLTDKSYSKTVTINCTKDDDGEWETDVNAYTSPFKSAVYGGLTETMNQ